MRGTTKTVNELAEELGLTDNGVRAHLLSLERDGLVKLSGVQPGVRKPHFAYELTAEAEHLFPKAYDTLVNQLIAALKGRLAPETLREVLQEVGRSLAGQQPSQGDSNVRLNNAIEALDALGGVAHVEREGGKTLIRSGGCPLATAVGEHPEVCQLAEALLAEIIGAKVTEHCQREGVPRCAFEIEAK
jgi:predicted ArsR family transcriptional regulator